MATVKPFPAFRYTAKAGDPSALITQPYDKINPAMRAEYLAASPYNLVRIILGERHNSDSDADNVYTRAAAHLDEWIREGLVAQDAAPGFYAYSQEFEIPDTGERATRQGFIGLTKVEDYDAKIIFRHEQTLTGPKKDRLELLRHTRAHFGQIFMLYPDPDGAVDKVLARANQGTPVLDMQDEYDVRHRVWAITDPAETEQVQAAMADKRLLVADGHHRYETALAYSKEHPDDPAAQYVMMTMVNMHAPGLQILPTHRVVRNLPAFDEEKLLAGSKQYASLDALKTALTGSGKPGVRIGVVSSKGFHLIEQPRKGREMDVPVLHTEILEGRLGITPEQVREQSFISYVRGADNAAAEVLEKDAQVAFLLNATPIKEMADIAFEGGVMPQKSTDFYPKLLSGVAIYKL